MKATENGWTKEKIQALLDRSDDAVMRALKQIYDRQTADEQQAHSTHNANSMGFTAFDAEFLTDVAQKMLKYRRLTPGQIDAVRKRIKKYWKQLLEIAAQHPKQAQ